MNDAELKSWTWVMPDGHSSNDWGLYRRRLEALAERRGWELVTLGTVASEPLLMLRTGAGSTNVPHLLVAGGFHGEEPAGPWGVLEYLEHAPLEQLSRVQLTVLPLVNATGFRAGTRFNAFGENPNRGYLGLPGENPSREGVVLLAHGDPLLEAARDGLLTCHEDVLLSHAYVYSCEPADAPGAFSKSLLAANAAHFPLHPDGTVDGCRVTDGLVFNHYDGSFESWLMKLGVARAACVETPGQHPIAQRIAAQRAMIEVFTAGA
ncbi:MAG: M14 family metallocarboxypeptidase [Gammaproteobacteria bacterium]|nr:M14 family metallocarboxypeptidase [Gammaproteobacteria bacterium]